MDAQFKVILKNKCNLIPFNRPMRRQELYTILQDTASCIEWARSKGILSAKMECPECGSDMKLCKDQSSDGQVWRCRKAIRGESIHDKKVSIRKGSIFECSTLAIRTIIFMLYEWSVMTSVDSTSYELSLDTGTITAWFRQFRTVASRIVESQTTGQLGGAEQIVEIDECQVGRRKYHRGRRGNEVWLLGIVVRGSTPQRVYIQDVRKRNRQTLEPIITQRVNVASRVMTDGWRAYIGLGTLGYRHSVVVHDTNFVSPVDPVIHTQNVENMWRCLRRFLNRRCSYSRRHTMSYVGEFVFRKNCVDPFETMLSAIIVQNIIV
jgi:transposase-like protein